MRVVKPWVHALQLSMDQYQSWAANVPKHESVTFWCLEKGMIRSAEYFAWAASHYGLPLLQESYFSLAPNRKLWENIQSVANWTPELLPLEEWDGVIFIGCVEPPEEIQWSFPVQYVLATARDLKYQWQRLNSDPTRHSIPFINIANTNPHVALEQTSPSMAQITPAPRATTAPAISLPGPSATAPNVPAAGNSNRSAKSHAVPTPTAAPKPAPAPTPVAEPALPSLNLDLSAALEPAPAAAATIAVTPTPTPTATRTPGTPAAASSTAASANAASAVIDTPAGLNLNLNFGPATPTETSAPSTAQMDVPEGLNLNPPQAARSTSPDGLTIPASHEVFYQDDIPTGIIPMPSLDATVARSDVKPLEPASKVILGTAATSPSESASNRAPGSAPQAMPTAPVPVKATAPAPAASTSAKPDAQSGAIDSDRMAQASIDSAQTTEEAIAWAFQQLKQHFSFSWILYRHENTLKVWHWDSIMRPTGPEAHAPIDLTQPSLFRVVQRSHMPYHGHVVASPINTQFFKAWGLRKTPAHVTATALLNDGHLTAVLLGASDTVPEDSDQVLRFCEKLTTLLSGHLAQKLAA